MALYKLIKNENNIGESELVLANICEIEKEKHVEGWVEKHPFCLGLGVLMIIHRQPSAKKEDGTVYPDLLAIDELGFLYVIELKKGRSPREIIAQSLEYASWLSTLDRDQFFSMAKEYLDTRNGAKSFQEHFMHHFEVEEMPDIKSKIKTVLVAENISTRILEVTDYLQSHYKMEVYPVEIKLYSTDDNGFFIETKLKGSVSAAEIISESSNSWSENKTAGEIVYEAAIEFTNGNKNKVFTHPDINRIIQAKYPGFNPRTIRCNIYANCVDHPSRIHYGGKHDYFDCAGKGKFTLHENVGKIKRAG